LFPQYEARKGDQQTCPKGESQNAENALAYFSILSMLGSARTLNQWLKRTLPKYGFSHPIACHFSLSLLDNDKTSILDEVIKVQLTLRFLPEASNGNYPQ
jgi:hypothetical protein